MVSPETGRMAPVSVLVLTYNEEKNLDRCLRSVAGWCREIHVVDSGSTDGTLAIARRYTPLVHHHPYIDHRDQLTWALQHVPFSCDWLLLLDADNVVTAPLEEQITAVLRGPDQGAEGYFVAHRYCFLGRPIRGFKRWSLRLVRRSSAAIDPSELVDWRFTVCGRIGYLSGELLEANANEDDLDFWIDKHQRFAGRAAGEEVLRGCGYLQWSVKPALFGTPDQRIVWLKERWRSLPLFVRPFLYFCYRYFVRLGFLDGWTGLLYHFLQAFWYRLLVDVKIWRLRRRLASGELSLAELARAYGLDSLAAGGPSGSMVAAQHPGDEG